MYLSTHCLVIAANSRVFLTASMFGDSCPQQLMTQWLTTNIDLVLLVLPTQLRDRPNSKCRLQEFLYCCMHICSCWKVFNKPLPSNRYLQGSSLIQPF